MSGFLHNRFELPYQNSPRMSGMMQAFGPRTLILTCSCANLDDGLIPLFHGLNATIVRWPANRLDVSVSGDFDFLSMLGTMASADAINEIAICGHSLCEHFAQPTCAESSSEPDDWYAKTVEKIKQVSAAARQSKQNVIAQLRALQSSPGVSTAVAQERLTATGYFYLVESQQLLVYDRTYEQFLVPEQDSWPNQLDSNFDQSF